MESGVHPARETQPEHKGEKSPHGWHIPAQHSPHIPEVREALWAQAQAQTTLARMAAWPTGSPRHRAVRGSTDPITHRGCGASPGDPSPAWMRPGDPSLVPGQKGAQPAVTPRGREPARTQRESSRAAPAGVLTLFRRGRLPARGGGRLAVGRPEALIVLDARDLALLLGQKGGGRVLLGAGALR